MSSRDSLVFITTLSSCRVLRIAVAMLATGVIAYLALRQSPHFGELSWMPRWLAHWADRHGVARNVPAFAGLYLVVLAGTGLAPRWVVWAAVGALGSLVEVAQLWMPARTFGWDDIAATWIGATAAHVPVCVSLALWAKFGVSDHSGKEA